MHRAQETIQETQKISTTDCRKISKTSRKISKTKMATQQTFVDVITLALGCPDHPNFKALGKLMLAFARHMKLDEANISEFLSNDTEKEQEQTKATVIDLESQVKQPMEDGSESVSSSISYGARCV